MINNLPSFVCTASLILLYINILGLLFMSKSLISTTEWELPSSSILTQYYELRSRLFHSANYSCTFTQNKVVLVQQFTLTYSEFVFVSLVALLGGVYLIIKIIRYISTLFRELGIINVKEKSDCPICMENMRRFIRVTSLPCGHSFCKRCLQLWVEKFRYDTCPMCRGPVDKSRDSAQYLHAIDVVQIIYTAVIHELSDEEYDNAFLY